VLRRWVRWGQTGVFTNEDGVNLEARFAEYRGPLIAVSIADDDYYAPAPAVDALTLLYAGASVRRERIHPPDFGVESIGHFGFFHPRAPRELWCRGERWLRDLDSAAGSGCRRVE
jgi:predicted alpha/beta hydrolase